MAAIYKDATQDDVMVKILQRIEESAATLTLNQLAKDIGYNRNYLSNLIKKRTQTTFKELVTKERLKNAQQLLIATTLPIEEISQYTGFSSKTQFYKKFREQYGQTPKELRDQAHKHLAGWQIRTAKPGHQTFWRPGLFYFYKKTGVLAHDEDITRGMIDHIDVVELTRLHYGAFPVAPITNKSTALSAAYFTMICFGLPTSTKACTSPTPASVAA